MIGEREGSEEGERREGRGGKGERIYVIFGVGGCSFGE